MPGRQLLMCFPVTETSHSLEEYRAREGYVGLAKALQMKPSDVVKEVLASGLQGRGGAAFAVGRKWQVIQHDDGQPHYLVANADEGEPGTFKDRWILENSPHQLLESMLITSYALNVRNCFVYIRGEFDLPYRRLAGAVEEAYAAGLFGRNILGTGFSCDIVVYRGAGAYVAGEASGLLASLEGKKSYPRNRPPRLTVKGLYQQPTVVNNVESLSNIAWIIRNGAEAFKAVGTPKSPGTRLFSVSGTHQQAGRLRNRTRLSVDEIPGRGLRRHARRPAHQVRGAGRCLVEGADGRRDRRPESLARSPVGRRLDTRLRRHDRDRRRHLHGAPAAGDPALLPPRIVRPVHALPSRHGLDAPHHRSHRRPAAGCRRTSSACITSPSSTTARPSAASATRRAMPAAASSTSSAMNSSTTSSTSVRALTGIWNA